MVKLLARKKIAFRNPETKETVTASPLVFATLPDWVTKDPMYEWAKRDGSIEVAGAPAEKAAPAAKKATKKG